ncbi:hypothetical protein FAM19031_000584 [Propionibacterium freudenreichii]|uniref:hypothetical protein n=1 Tax=Propionibacterium freudenreichii TaxID=1744 RepID=UPI00243411C9|nr:hypothetical protein [Propionibacterium freudenreichii]MDK9294546.1 hypothetical protein [Propionibacterium freudenreichii]MDK9359875.1 hypothetical protein [Propionibacterium freudenreichii]MDK9657908.1 hypothetical protein [Propionibacterium freudenreichii]WFF31061.1 hypothetical protein FAM19024_000249 [Propionibacterium freudenreichii]
MAISYRIDSSPCDHLPMCGCGWRGDPVATKLEALAQVSRHQRRAHPGDSQALAPARSRARRAARFGN